MAKTPQEIISDHYFNRMWGVSQPRLRIHYGDTETGRDWGDLYDVSGTIGRSNGRQPVYLLIQRQHSVGGTAILMDCIVRIRFANRKDGGDLYRHPTYSQPERKNYSDKEWAQHFA